MLGEASCRSLSAGHLVGVYRRGILSQLKVGLFVGVFILLDAS